MCKEIDMKTKEQDQPKVFTGDATPITLRWGSRQPIKPQQENKE